MEDIVCPLIDGTLLPRIWKLIFFSISLKVKYIEICFLHDWFNFSSLFIFFYFNSKINSIVILDLKKVLFAWYGVDDEEESPEVAVEMVECVVAAQLEPVRRLHQVLAQPQDVALHLLVQHLLRHLSINQQN
jgi:hypothetical protein